MSLTYSLKRTGEINPPVPRPPARPHVTVRGISRLEGRFESPTSQVGLNVFHQARGEFERHELVGKAVDPCCVECLGHIKENCACEPLLAKVPGDCFISAGQLQGCAMFRSETKLLITQ
jgi:hypothetical protein